MNVVLRLGKHLNIISLYTVLIMMIYGKNAFIISTNTDIDTVCVNQFIPAFFITFVTYIYAKTKHLAVTRSVYDIFINSEIHIRIIVIVSALFCFVLSCIYFKKFYIQYLIICILHSVSILACSAILRQNS